MAITPTSFAPGTNLRCTVSALPRTADQQSTLERLMRRDPAAKRALRRAAVVRGQRLNVYIRGNREWTSRERPAKVVRVSKGATWSMFFTPDIARDLASIEGCVTIAKA